MRIARWLCWLKWPVTLGLLSGVLAGAYFVNGRMKAERAAEAEDGAERTPRRSKNGVVTLGPEMIEGHRIETAPAKAIDWSDPISVYGRLVPNPRASSVVQAPLAGTVQADDKQPWPGVGTRVKAGQVLGRINVRVGPHEQLDLQLKLKEARLKVQGAVEVAAIHQKRLERLEKSSKGGAIVSQRELDDARVQLTEAKTNLSTAQAAMDLWSSALDAIERHGGPAISTYSLPLTAPGDGEVVETPARPGTSVEAGSVIAGIVDFRRPLAQMDMPPEVLATGPPVRIELTILPPSPAQAASPSPRLTADLLGPVPQVDATSQFSSFWYEATIKAEPTPNLQAAWRPGRFVSARLRLPNASKRAALAVPMSSVLAHQGRLLVYVQEAPGKYERREIHLLGREGNEAILAGGVKPGESVVAQGSQLLLSEEFRSLAEDQ
jgi:cobalt-zinc-cadmium efflux system membrane fusion protein